MDFFGFGSFVTALPLAGDVIRGWVVFGIRSGLDGLSSHLLVLFSKTAPPPSPLGAGGGIVVSNVVMAYLGVTRLSPIEKERNQGTKYKKLGIPC